MYSMRTEFKAQKRLQLNFFAVKFHFIGFVIKLLYNCFGIEQQIRTLTSNQNQLSTYISVHS